MNPTEISECNLIEKEFYKRALDYKPNKKQLLFHKAGLIAQERLVTGGNRSGKTHGGKREAYFHLSGNYNEFWEGYKYKRPINAWIAGKTSSVVAETIQKDFLGDPKQGIKGMVPEDLIISKVRSGNSEMYRTVYIKNSFGGNSKITFKSYDEGWKAFQGGKVDLVMLDEEPPFEIYKECQMRTMKTSKGDDSKGMIIVCSTPLQGYTDFFNYFMDDTHPETVKESRWYTHIEWDDTEHLPEEEKKRLLGNMSPHQIEARTKGIPSPGSGLVYPIPESMIICDPFEIPKYWAKFYVVDFGWLHPAILFFAHDRDNDVLYAYAEYSVPQRTPEAHADALQNSGIDWMPGVYDPAGGADGQRGDSKTVVGLFISAGFKNLLTPADNSVEKGILKTLQKMQASQFRIFSTLIKTRSEFRKYNRDENGIPQEKNDHFMDCIRYGVMSGMSVAIPENFRYMKEHEGMYYQSNPGYYL